MKLSVIIPAYNEEEHLEELINRLDKVLPYRSEIVVINNGSTDNSLDLLKRLKQYGGLSKTLIAMDLRLSGKTLAIKKGIENSTGNLIAMIDADLQYNPEDVVTLLGKLEVEQTDFVNGWRDFSSYPPSRRFFSYIYNWLYRRMFNVNVHDANCGLKLFKREVAGELVYRKGFHRYFVAMASEAGYTVVETKVSLNKSEGKSSYGIRRILDGFFDLGSIKLSITVLKKPMVFFGVSSIILILSGILYSFFEKTFFPTILIVSGFISFMFGLIAEMIINLERGWRLGE